MSVLRGTSITAALTLVSRIFGFVRDLLVARLFGASALADAYFVAFRIPNLLRSFVAEGALSSAFVPVFVEQSKHGEAARNAAFRQAIGFALLLSGAVTLLGILFAPSIISVIAPGFDAEGPEKQELTVNLTRIMFPLLIGVSLVAAIGGALNALKIFGAPAISQIWMNAVLIAGAFIAPSTAAPIYTLAWSVVVGGALQVLVQIPALKRAGLPCMPTLSWTRQVVGAIGNLLIPAMFGAAIYQALIALATVFASLLGDGAVSWLFYADRLTQLPVGIFSVALATVLLPVLARASTDSDRTRFAFELDRSLRYTSLVLIPTSVWLWAEADLFVKILFERGSFTSFDSAQTADVVRGLSVGLWTMSCQSMLSRAFIATKDTKTPSYLGALSLLMYCVVAAFLVVEVRGAFATYLPVLQNLPGASLGAAGLALASSLTSSVSFIVAALLVGRRFPDFVLTPLLVTSVKVLIASILSAVVWRESFSMLSQLAFFEHSQGLLLSLMISGGCAIVSLLAAILILRVREASELWQAIMRKLF